MNPNNLVTQILDWAAVVALSIYSFYMLIRLFMWTIFKLVHAKQEWELERIREQQEDVEDEEEDEEPVKV